MVQEHAGCSKCSYLFHCIRFLGSRVLEGRTFRLKDSLGRDWIKLDETMHL
jgi:hypothetical protein